MDKVCTPSHNLQLASKVFNYKYSPLKLKTLISWDLSSQISSKTKNTILHTFIIKFLKAPFMYILILVE